jgi:hypothetical protein
VGMTKEAPIILLITVIAVYAIATLKNRTVDNLQGSGRTTCVVAVDRYQRIKEGMSPTQAKAWMDCEPTSASASDIGGGQTMEIYYWQGSGRVFMLSFVNGRLGSKTMSTF